MPRSSMDSVCNGHGVRMLDLCKATGLRIVNGRLYQDTRGSYTFANAQGASVIDYLLTKPECFYLLSDFAIKPFNGHSDHACISFSL